MDQPQQQIFDLPEAAKYLRMSERALQEACLAQRVSFSKLNYRTWRFTRADLEDFIRRNRRQARTVYGPKPPYTGK